MLRGYHQTLPATLLARLLRTMPPASSQLSEAMSHLPNSTPYRLPVHSERANRNHIGKEATVTAACKSRLKAETSACKEASESSGG